MLWTRRWLGASSENRAATASRPSLRDWIERYRHAGREHRVRIPGGSTLVGKTIGEIDLRSTSGASIVAIERSRRFARELIGPTANTELCAEDVLLVDLFRPDASVETLRERFALEVLPLSGEKFADRSQEIGMAKVMLTATSDLAGKTIVESKFRTRFGLTMIGLRHGDTAQDGNLQEEKLGIGDTLLVIGLWKSIQRLRSDAANLIVLNLPAEMDDVLPASGKAPQAVFCLLLMVGLMISGLVPNVQAALIACLLMGALRCIDFDSAYRSVHWKSLVLIVGKLPLSLALQRTGGVEIAANALMSVTGAREPTWCSGACSSSPHCWGFSSRTRPRRC